MAAPDSPAPRLASLDALRGFDMFWIIGGGSLHGALKNMGDSPLVNLIDDQFEHANWIGFHFLDLVFPMFVFIAGVSLALSLPRKASQRGKAATARSLVVRAAILFVIGVLYSGGISRGLAGIRWLGVLQRIALASLGAGLLSLWLRPRALAITCGALLLGYWALLTLLPFPGGTPGDLREGHNVVNWFDSHYLPGRKYNGDHDPEGILSTLPAIANCLLGVLAGIFLRTTRADGSRKSLHLVAGGVALLALGLLWSVPFPMIKKLWTSSFVLFACGCSTILLGAFHQIIEVRNLRAWASPFIWIGLNPITIYLAAQLMDFHHLADRFVGPRPGLLHAAAATGIGVLLAWWLQRRRIFIRV